MEFYLLSFVFCWLCLVLVASRFQFCIGEPCCINSFLNFFFLYKLKGKTLLSSEFFQSRAWHLDFHFMIRLLVWFSYLQWFHKPELNVMETVECMGGVQCPEWRRHYSDSLFGGDSLLVWLWHKIESNVMVGSIIRNPEYRPAKRCLRILPLCAQAEYI